MRVEPPGDRCLSEAVVRARVLKRLAREAELSDVEVIVQVAETPRLDVLRGGQRVAERRFEHFPASCNARRDAIAVAVALALERARETELPPSNAASESSAAAGAATASSDSPSPERESPAKAEQAPAPPVEPAASEGGAREEPASGRTPWSLGAHAGAVAVLEVLPALAFAGVLGVDVKVGGARVSLAALASLEQRDGVLGAAIDSRLVLGRALVALDLARLGDFAVEGGAGLLAGAVFASGDGYASDRSTERGYAAALARAALRFPARGVLAARLSADALVPFVRPSYALVEDATGTITATTPAPVGAALGLEAVLTLP